MFSIFYFIIFEVSETHKITKKKKHTAFYLLLFFIFFAKNSDILYICLRKNKNHLELQSC